MELHPCCASALVCTLLLVSPSPPSMREELDPREPEVHQVDYQCEILRFFGFSSCVTCGFFEPTAISLDAYLIFVLFSPQSQFLARFFSTPKRVNHDKTDFATKRRKSHKRKILQQNSIKCDKTSKIAHIIYFVHNILI